jgi:hypothetical protein
LSSFKSEPNSRSLMFWSIQSRLHTIGLSPMILLKVRVVLMLIGVYNTGILNYEYVVMLLSFVPWRCGRKWYIKLLELCIPTFLDVVTRHYQQECVLIIFGHSCLENMETRSSLCSFVTSLSLTNCLNCVEVKSFWYDILLYAYYNY